MSVICKALLIGAASATLKLLNGGANSYAGDDMDCGPCLINGHSYHMTFFYDDYLYDYYEYYQDPAD